MVVRDQATREALAELNKPAVRRYAAQVAAGESPWNPLQPARPDGRGDRGDRGRRRSSSRRCSPRASCSWSASTSAMVASTDQDLDRVGLVSGASVYPLVWNILLAARNEGFGGTITTMAVAEEPRVKELLGIPEQYAVAAVVPLGKPVKQPTSCAASRSRSSSPASGSTASRSLGENPGGPPAAAGRRRGGHQPAVPDADRRTDRREEPWRPGHRRRPRGRGADHRGALRARTPDALVLGEEATAADDTLADRFRAADHAFTVDPVDGTKNFVHGSPDHAVMVAEVRGGEVGARLDLAAAARHGVRRRARRRRLAQRRAAGPAARGGARRAGVTSRRRGSAGRSTACRRWS